MINKSEYSNYGKASGIILVDKYLKKISPFIDISLINSVDEWLKIKDEFDTHTIIRPDTLIGDDMIRLEGCDGMLSSIPNMIEEMKKINKNSVLLLGRIKNEQIPRYLDDGGFNILFDIGSQVVIELVGKGFDGRELTHGLTVHEEYIIPWNSILFITSRKSLSKYTIGNNYIIDSKTYISSRDERIKFLMSRCSYLYNVIDENIPREYHLVDDFIMEQIINDVIFEIVRQSQELYNDNLNLFCVQGNIINKHLEVWEIFRDKRLIKKLVK